MKARVISALVAVAIIISLYMLLNITGLYVVCFIVVSVCAVEYLQMTLAKVTAPTFVHVTFLLSLITIYLAAVFIPEYNISVFGTVSIIFMTILLFTAKRTIKLSRITLKQGLGIMGFLYCGIFPALATRLLKMDNGDLWLFTLMGVVFAGDTFAYLVGKGIGKNKLYEKLSPKKTIEGSIGGLLGSCAFGATACYVFFEGQHLGIMIVISILTGAFAQIGDLYESLLKRVANVKDSGKVMPGHGGILDRVDGVYFGAPVFYTLVLVFQI